MPQPQMRVCEKNVKDKANTVQKIKAYKCDHKHHNAMGCSGPSIASVVLMGTENVLQSLAVSIEQKNHGDTGPDHYADKYGIMGKPQEHNAYTESRCKTDPLTFNVSFILCVLWTTDFHWNVDII